MRNKRNIVTATARTLFVIVPPLLGHVRGAELLAETMAGDEQLSSVAVLGGVRERAENILATVKTRAELAVSELCQTFSPEA